MNKITKIRFRRDRIFCRSYRSNIDLELCHVKQTQILLTKRVLEYGTLLLSKQRDENEEKENYVL